ncbi:hypothetical protein N8654_03435 [Synechococcus sp. AH-601-B19]|nr:hypothetical protein [Synechococcus sp. AH-601-B19]
MKHVLTAVAALAFASPAMAIDYVKCEAIQGAGQRLRVAKASKAQTAWKTEYRLTEERNCGKRDVLNPSYDALSWLKCANASDQSSAASAEAKVEAEYDERIAKVEADYQAAGCY